MRRSIAVLLLLLFACGRELDPMDKAAIERDLEERSVRELYDAADQMPWHKPDDYRLTETHIADFIRVAALAERIVEVVGARLEEQLDQASREDNRFARMGNAFSAFGSARVVGTAHLRAALTLDVNPNQQQWVAERIHSAAVTLSNKRRYDDAVASAQREYDQETNPFLRERKAADLQEAKDRLAGFEQGLGDAELANVRMVERHRVQLARFFPFLRRD